MPTLTGPPITLTAIQTEFSTSGLVASSTAAGLDPLPTSMLDFIGLSSYTPQVRVDATSGSGVWTVPSGCTQIWVLIVGGGAGGGGALAGSGYLGEAGGYSANAGGGGGGGAVATLSAFAVTAGQTVSYTVGAAGVGGVGSLTGDSGGTTSATYSGGGSISAAGGVGGTAGTLTNISPGSSTSRGNGGASGNGNAGGPGSNVEWGVDARYGGGGGGNDAVGGSGKTASPGLGGAGTSVSLNGLSDSGPYGQGGNGGMDNNRFGTDASAGYGRGGGGGFGGGYTPVGGGNGMTSTPNVNPNANGGFGGGLAGLLGGGGGQPQSNFGGLRAGLAGGFGSSGGFPSPSQPMEMYSQAPMGFMETPAVQNYQDVLRGRSDMLVGMGGTAQNGYMSPGGMGGYNPSIDNRLFFNNAMAGNQYSSYAQGGNVRSHLGGYSDGGRLLRGPGDGVSDSIPASIGKQRQPARLADGEFVVPARIVSELGNGSTEAGARKLYAMMDRIQAARRKTVGKGRVAKNSRAEKYLPA